MSSELKTCPFCGSEPTVRRSLIEYKAEGGIPSGEYEEGISISFHTYGFEMADEYRDDVSKAWNTRATPYADPLQGLVRYLPVTKEAGVEMLEADHGEYVLHSEAAKVVAAKEGQISDYKNLVDVLHAERARIKADALKWQEHQKNIKAYMESWSKFKDEQEKFENGQ